MVVLLLFLLGFFNRRKVTTTYLYIYRPLADLLTGISIAICFWPNCEIYQKLFEVFESLSYHENMHLLQSDEFVNNNKIGEIFDERLQD